MIYELKNLKKKLIEMENGYKFKLQDLRGNIRGLLSGRLKRMLEEALVAAQDEKPWMKAIQERLEMSIEMINKKFKEFSEKQKMAHRIACNYVASSCWWMPLALP